MKLVILIFLTGLTLSGFAIAETTDHWFEAVRIHHKNKKFSIPVQTGKKIVSDLRTASGKGNTTSNRKERKAVLLRSDWDRILNDLRSYPVRNIPGGKILFEARDTDQIPGRTNATVTYYGLAGKFYHHGVTTKMRMRVRFYVSYQETYEGRIHQVQRADSTKDGGMLELKIKNPGPSEEHSVHKYRMYVPDDLLERLFTVNPHSEDARILEQEILNVSKVHENRPESFELNKLFLSTLFSLGRSQPRFLQALWVITYNRKALAFTEPAYPLHFRPEKAPHGLKTLVRKLKKPFAFLKKSSKEKIQETQAVQYQITTDEHVKIHRPLTSLVGGRLPVTDYFQEAQKTALASYPSQSIVIEFKDPAPVAWYDKPQRSEVHQILTEHLLNPMMTHMISGFSTVRGKAGHFNAWINNPIFCPNISATAN